MVYTGRHEALADAAQSLSILARRRARRPIDYVRWLPLQCEFLLSPAKVKQIRAGNQFLGKSWAALAEVVGRCEGRHPLGLAVPPPPVTAWIVCASWSQSMAVQEKLNALLAWEELDPRTKYDPVNGFSPTKRPCIVFRNGSRIWIKTTGQDSIEFSSATIDIVLFDEPPQKQRMFVEALQRVQERGGVLLLSYTPVNAPTEYLRELCEAGVIEDHWHPLTAAELIPVGQTRPLRTKDGRPKDQAWIDERRSQVPAYEQPVVIDGGWEFRAQGAYFDGAWDSTRLVYEATIDKTDRLVLGIDHGDRPGKQVAVLMAVDTRQDPPSVHVIDIYRDEIGTASPADDARGILAMLTRHGLTWDRLHFAGGDRVHLPGSGKQKSNRDLAAQIRKILKVKELAPSIRTVKRGEGRGAGSLTIGSRWLFHAMVAGRFSVDPRCTPLIDAIPKYTLREDDEGTKDLLDAIRYGLDQWVFSWARTASPTIRLHR